LIIQERADFGILIVMEIFAILTLIRLIVPFSILKWPLPGILLSNLADLYDWQFAPVHNAADMKLYQTWDKAMDLYYWLFALVIVFRWKDIWAKRIAVGLFLYRIAGMGLFFVTGARSALFFFPNIFENFVILYLSYAFIFKDKLMFKTKRDAVLVLALLAIPKIIHEYYLHFLEHQPWEYYNVGQFFGLTGFFEEYTNYFAWGGLFYIIPFIILFFYFRRQKAKS